jgi:hypothetical protein
MKNGFKWTVGVVFVLWILFGHPLNFIAGIFWPESNAPWENVDAYYYPNASNLSDWKSQMDIGSVQACRDWVEGSAAIMGDVDLRRGDYECGVGCKTRDGLNICRLTIE